MSQAKNNKTIAAVAIVVIIIVAGAAFYLTQKPTVPATNTSITESMTSAPMKIALIMPGRTDDLAWNQASYNSFEDLLTNRNEGINTCGCWVQNHQESAQIQADVRDFVSKGYNLIIGSGFEFQIPIQEIAPQYPNTNFLVIAGWNN